MHCLSQSGLHSSLLICFRWHHFKSNFNLTITLSLRRDGSYIRQFTGWRQNVLFFQFSIWNWHKDWCGYCTCDQGKTVESCAINRRATVSHLKKPAWQLEVGEFMFHSWIFYWIRICSYLGSVGTSLLQNHDNPYRKINQMLIPNITDRERERAYR